MYFNQSLDPKLFFHLLDDPAKLLQGDEMSLKILRREIVGLSIADEWNSACEEWHLSSIHRSEEPMSCLCGHSPIREICTIVNKYNSNCVEVGNCCVELILNTGSKSMFRSLSKVIEDGEASLNPGVIELAHERNFVDDSERDFYLGIWRKRKLSPEQSVQKFEINERLLAQLVR